MVEFLASWGLELIFGLIAAGITAFFTWKTKEWKSQREHYEALLTTKETEETDRRIEEKLEPIYEELEALRRYIRETESIEKTHMSLIIASYRFRLIQLCREFIRQGYLTQQQFDQLNEFYRVYTGLGGNGQAQNYYERAAALPIHDDNDNNN